MLVLAVIERVRKIPLKVYKPIAESCSILRLTSLKAILKLERNIGLWISA